MTKFVTDKDIITKKVLEILDPEYTEKKFHQARTIWWKNIRSGGGLRLTEIGNKCFQSAGLEFTEHKFGRPTALQLLELDRKIACPYYVEIRTREIYILLYDSRVSVMCVLHETVKGYLDTL